MNFFNATFSIVCLCICLVFSGCKKNRVSLWIDNPTNSFLNVSLNDESYQIEPKNMQVIDINKGTYLAKAWTEDSVFFLDSLSIYTSSLLNTTSDTYILWKALYTLQYGTHQTLLHLDTFHLNGYSYPDVDFTVFTDSILIEKNWDYDVMESFPDSVRVFPNDYQILSKLYRLEDLENEWGVQHVDLTIDLSTYENVNTQALIDSLEQVLNQIDSIKNHL